MDLRKEFIRLKTWIWERHDISIQTRIIDEYLYEKGYDKMPRLTEAQIKAMAGRSNENSGLHKHFVSVSLLKKYMAHVIDCEGIDYVDSVGYPPSDQEFTDEEQQLLQRLSEEISNER